MLPSLARPWRRPRPSSDSRSGSSTRTTSWQTSRRLSTRRSCSTIPMPGEKQPIREVEGRWFLRIPIWTHVVTEADDIVDVARRYASQLLQPGDLLFVGEKAVAITQGRAIPISTMHPGLLARFLWRFVRQTSYGVGLRDPYSMQAAIDEVGALRILFAALVGGLTRASGRRGDFYRIAGVQAAAIDAPGTAGLDQFKDRVIKGPKDPTAVADRLGGA